MSTVSLVTGFPTSFLATRLVRKILAEKPEDQVRCVVQEQFLESARRSLEALTVRERTRVEILEGDVASIDLGLSGSEFKRLCREVQVIHHCAASTYLATSRDVMTRVNVDGTREVLELAREVGTDLQRLVHWSTALVSGARRGFVREDELSAPEGFRNPVEETRFKSEKLVRRAAQSGVPTTILRPSIVVGDSITGEIDHFEGPYLLILLMLSSPVDLRVPLPGRGEILLNLVPVDYVVNAGWAIVNDPHSIGRTFHIVDPAPLSVRRVFEAIATAAGRPIPRGFLPTSFATTLLRTPGIERIAQVPRAFLEQLATEVAYDDRNARAVLDPLGIRCPRFTDYVDVMVEYVKREQGQRKPVKAADTDDHDSLHE